VTNAGFPAMTTVSTALPLALSLDQFRDLRDIIYEKSGIFFAENKLYLLENRLGRRLKELELPSFGDYIDHIKNQGGASSEFHQIFNAVTINETFFFRFQAQLEVFKKLFTDLTKQRLTHGKRSIDIWSAASSSGEELYTLAIIISESLGPQLRNWNIRLFGTDISHRALKRAQDAAYSKNSFRGSMTVEQKQRYFEEEGNLFRVKDQIKDMVQFRYLNLNDVAEIRRMANVDFIFCRNVMIYFDDEMKKRVLRSMYGMLNHGGYFFLGEAESLHGISSSFKVEHFSGAFTYKKE
jgi:chemotaxis protein methyltransferase CheR